MARVRVEQPRARVQVVLAGPRSSNQTDVAEEVCVLSKQRPIHGIRALRRE
jgi:hypothetical protein